MTTTKPLLVKRYASRRLYNTETSDYVTLEDIAKFIRAGRDVQIIDLKTGDDLTRQYLLQIIAEHESRGDNVLPIEILTDLVRSYTTQVQSVVPDFLAMSFEMLRDGQSKFMDSFAQAANPISQMPGFDALREQQAAFLKAMSAGFPSQEPAEPEKQEDPEPETSTADDLSVIKDQLAALQEQLNKLGK